MPRKIQHEYNSKATADVDSFVVALKENSASQGGGAILDSAAASDFISSAINQGNGVSVPENLQIILDEAGEGHSGNVVRALLDGISHYEEQHGVNAPADIIEQAIHSAYSTTKHAKAQFQLDSASSDSHDPMGLQSNRAVVSIISTLAEAIPFAHYLPADIGSNKAKLAIMSHHAGNKYGEYDQMGLMDGVNSGSIYVSSSRVHTANPDAAGKVSGKLTALQSSPDHCVQDAPALTLLRGRTLVYVNGMPVGKEVESTGTGNSTISGQTTIAGTAYRLSGFVSPDTGVFAIETTPAMPSAVPVAVEGFINYEAKGADIPLISTQVNTFDLYAKSWRVGSEQTIDSRTQMANELGLDPYSESVFAISTQYANERHYETLAKAMRLARNNQEDWNFEWSSRSPEMNRAQIWQDFSYPLGIVSQQMAITTMSYGVSFLYVGKRVAAQWLALPRDLFEPSGISERPGIFRLGRLFGRYDVYYTPKLVQETANTAQVLCIGRANDVARNPFVLGDAVPPMTLPIPMQTNMTTGSAFYARGFTSVNPHEPSAQGAALINITNMQQ